MNEIKMGVIGAGVLGSYHIDKCLQNPEVKLCGFYDANPARRREIMEKFKIPGYDNIIALLNEVQAVIIATPCSTHHVIARQCLDSGKHVFVEKPLASSYSQGEELVYMADKRGLILNVGHSEAFNAAFTRLCSFKPAPRFIEAHRLAYYSPRGTDVSVILDLMVHDLQLVLRLCKEEPVYGRIAATGVPVISKDIDIANVRLLFPSGCVANLTASRISAKRMRKIRIFSTGSYFSVDLDKGEIEKYSLKQLPISPGAIPVESLKEKVEAKDALENELQSFVKTIKGEKDCLGVDGKEALIVLKVTDVILELLSSGSV
ncbi:MAG TPA: hypothetical protein DCO75_09420 [Fibrobacteres bacterium]|jgi:predicted dehydrogenase|nr:hypothetical protein [Fibrobacterota bacterium]